MAKIVEGVEKEIVLASSSDMHKKLSRMLKDTGYSLLSEMLLSVDKTSTSLQD
jgi:hypothetical protein